MAELAKEPIKRRVRDGVEEFRCTACFEWKPRENFASRPRNSWGIHGRCHVCRREREKAYRERTYTEFRRKRKEVADRVRQAARQGRKKHLRGEVKASTPTHVPREQVLPFLERLLEQHYGLSSINQWSWDLENAAARAGTTPRTLTAIRSGERKMVGWRVAEGIAIAAGLQVEFLAQFPEPGIDGWNKAGDRHCRRCGAWEVPHKARGLCVYCYEPVRKGHRSVSDIISIV